MVKCEITAVDFERNNEDNVLLILFSFPLIIPCFPNSGIKYCVFLVPSILSGCDEMKGKKKKSFHHDSLNRSDEQLIFCIQFSEINPNGD